MGAMPIVIIGGGLTVDQINPSSGMVTTDSFCSFICVSISRARSSVRVSCSVLASTNFRVVRTLVSASSLVTRSFTFAS